MAKILKQTEIIAIASGKGGTGKTLFAASLGYALIAAGHKVLMLDSDVGTDGLSLFLLGQESMRSIKKVTPKSSVINILHHIEQHNSADYQPFTIARADHGLDGQVRFYDALVSSRGLYGDENGNSCDSEDGAEKESDENKTDPMGFEFRQSEYSDFLEALLRKIKQDNEYDYVIVDTRGGFAFQSIEASTLADSFIVVTEPDYTSFYQDRNLVKRINESAQRKNKKAVLRAVVVNKATEDEEKQFRLAIQKELGLSYEDTYALPLDIEAVKAYKTQQMPFVVCPQSRYSFYTINALSSIMNVTISQWGEEKINRWNSEVNRIKTAIGEYNEEVRAENKRREEQAKRYEKNERQLADYERTIADLNRQLDANRGVMQSESRRNETWQSRLDEESSQLKQENMELSNALKYQSASLSSNRYRNIIIVAGFLILFITVGAYTYVNNTLSVSQLKTLKEENSVLRYELENARELEREELIQRRMFDEKKTRDKKNL